MRARSLLTVLTSTAVAAGLVLAPTSASAGAPIETVREFVDALCHGGWSGGRVEVGFSARSVTDDVRIDVFQGEQHVAGGFHEDVLTRDGLALSMQAPVPLYSVGEEPVEVGAGVAAVALALDGEPRTLEATYQHGNVRFTETQVVSPLAGSGTLDLSFGAVSETVALDCSGDLAIWTERQTAPDAVTARVEIGNLWCRGWLEDGQPVHVFIEAGMHEVVELYVGDPVTIGGFTMELTESRHGLSSLVPLWDGDGAEIGSAQLELAVDELPGERDRFVLRHSTGAQFFVIESLRASGSIQLPGETVRLDCDGERTLVHEKVTTPAREDGTGPAPVNDAPAAAIPLQPGSRDNVQTRAASLTAELPYWCYQQPPDPADLVPGRTVWYAFTGTGGSVTVDTAGSSFNTALAVYRVEPAADHDVLIEESCVDDVPKSLQASATVPTEAGVRYLVQVGGHASQWGLLKVALR